jgi:uncharacterized protein (TIGR02147 family)
VALDRITERLQYLRGDSLHTKISDGDLYDQWYNSLIYELAALPDFDGDPVRISARLGNLVTAEQVQGSLKFLAAKGWLLQQDGQWQRKPIHFSGGNKNRSINLMTLHRRFLEIASHRLNDDINEREFQGYTVAIPWHKFSRVRELMREFIDKVEAETTTDESATEVIRIQCCAFKITRHQ